MEGQELVAMERKNTQKFTLDWTAQKCMTSLLMSSIQFLKKKNKIQNVQINYIKLGQLSFLRR